MERAVVTDEILADIRMNLKGSPIANTVAY
jgi:hypothetical protein